MNLNNYFDDLFKVYETNHELVRLGKKSDGGYVVSKDLAKKTDTLISIGVEDNISFENDFYNLNKKLNVILIDGTITDLPADEDKFKFINKNLDINNSDKTINLESVVSNLQGNLALQMDIEYDEWKIFANLDENILNKFCMLIVEFHLIFIDENVYSMSKKLTPYFSSFYETTFRKINYEQSQNYKKVIQKILKNFTVVHLHANNSLPKEKYLNTYYPPLLEVTFIHNDEINKCNEFNGTLPIQNLDFPNKSDRPDIYDYYPFRKIIK